MNHIRTIVGCTALAAVGTLCQGQVFNLPDASTDTGAYTGYGTGPMITPAGFTGVDNTFEGQVVFNITLDVQAAQASLYNTGAVNFTLYNGNTRILAVGNAWFQSTWSFWKAIGDPNIEIPILDDLGQVVKIGGETNSIATETLIVTLNYAAGGADTGTVRFGEGTALTQIPSGDYSFNAVMAGGLNAPTNFTNMTMTVTAVPEPATWAGFAGLAALALALARRRRS